MAGSSGSDEDVNVGKKRKQNPRNYKRNQIKSARLSGQAYESFSGKKVEEKKVGNPCRCSAKCFEHIGPENVQDTFNRFYSAYKTKDEQDLFLHGLIDVGDVVTRRPGSRDIKGKEREENANIRPKKKAGGNSNTIFLLETGE
ncbi:hypothetical protein J6590_081537 [Homalodisca vitripennis]|nr:hypothetical protein J6590_081537 [Homalodisca vitripennis]